MIIVFAAQIGALSAFVFFEKIYSRVGHFYCNMSEGQILFLAIVMSFP